MTHDLPLWFIPATVLPSLTVSLLAGFVIRRWAPRWGLVDHPGTRKVHVAPTPLGGGMAIWLAVIIPLGLVQVILWFVHFQWIPPDWLPGFFLVHLDGLWHQSGQLWVLLTAATVLMMVGLADDRWGLGWKPRLLIQFLIAAGCVIWQGWRLTLFLDLPALTWTLSVIWIVGLINSFNMLDNMDGLSSGIAAIASSILAAVLLTFPASNSGGPQLFVGGFLLVLVGSLLGFLWHNRPVARLFMGDAGSYFVGFCVAISTLLATYADYGGQAKHAVLAPLVVMAVPLYDTVTVIWIRIREGRSPFQPDKNHFSHRLVDLGLTKGQAVLTIYLTTITCGLGALLLRRVDAFGAAVIVLIVFCILALIAILEATSRRRTQGNG
jgi:UDP-GlcNAc:undecaprenyl-phosphate/decaprenyl-phosphate GlcNAc-1-phosphate transferase